MTPPGRGAGRDISPDRTAKPLTNGKAQGITRPLLAEWTREAECSARALHRALAEPRILDEPTCRHALARLSARNVRWAARAAELAEVAP